MQTLQNQPQRDKASIVDPNGFLFHQNDKIYRAIYPQNKDFYLGLFKDGTVGELTKSYQLIDSQLSDMTVDSLPHHLFINHRKLDKVNYCNEWTFSMLKDAAELTLQMNKYLLERDLVLQDAYPWNIIFEGTQPKFVDFGSIAKNEHKYLWQAQQQFLNFFYYPLILLSQDKGKFVRFAFQECIEGINIEDCYSYTDAKYFFRHPLIFTKLKLETALHRFLNKKQHLKMKLKAGIEGKLQDIKVKKEIQVNFAGKLLKQLKGIKAPTGYNFWEDYYQFQDHEIDYQKKLDFLTNYFKSTPHQDVLDLGCNTGRFSIVAAEAGKRVVSVDGSEQVIDGLYNYAKKNKLNITPLVVNLLNPTPAYGFDNEQFGAFKNRMKSEVVLFLGIMHHIHINGRQTFENIASFLNHITKKELIFEYVALDDRNNQFLDSGRKIQYTKEEVLGHLGKYFNITEHESDRPTRKLLVCSKK